MMVPMMNRLHSWLYVVVARRQMMMNDPMHSWARMTKLIDPMVPQHMRVMVALLQHDPVVIDVPLVGMHVLHPLPLEPLQLLVSPPWLVLPQ